MCTGNLHVTYSNALKLSKIRVTHITKNQELANSNPESHPCMTPDRYQPISDEVEEAVHDNREWLMKVTKLKTDESKRIGLHKTYSEVFGMVGSFKQLEFD